MEIKPGPLLAEINSPEDLKKLDVRQLTQVCQELRDFIIDNLPSLGAVTRNHIESYMDRLNPPLGDAIRKYVLEAFDELDLTKMSYIEVSTRLDEKIRS